MLEKSVLERLDKLAFNRPGTMPPEIMRTDKAAYKVYFRFMCCLYLMYRNGTLNAEELRRIKAEFIKDFELYDLFQSAAIKGAKEFMKLDAAIIACNKNKDSCEYCRGIYNARLAAAADDPDIMIERGEAVGQQ